MHTHHQAQPGACTPHPSRSAPRCCDCLHRLDLANQIQACNHPTTPVSAIDGTPLLSAAVMRSADAKSVGSLLVCGPSGLLFAARSAPPQAGEWPPIATLVADIPGAPAPYTPNAPAAARSRFKVCAITAAGQRTEYDAIGGSSCGHAVDALDAAGLGGSVNVRPMRSADMAGEVPRC